MTLVVTTTQFAFIETLTAQLLARTGLAGVDIRSYTFDLDTANEMDILYFIDTDMDEEAASTGNLRHQETYTVTGEIASARPGAGEDEAQACRDRAQAILAELEDELRINHTMNRTVKWCRLSRVALKQGYSDRGRICVVSFTITAFASLPRS